MAEVPFQRLTITIATDTGQETTITGLVKDFELQQLTDPFPGIETVKEFADGPKLVHKERKFVKLKAEWISDNVGTFYLLTIIDEPFEMPEVE